MVGGSYGGAVQLATASVDRRLDTIIPFITWNDLSYSFGPNHTGQTSGVSTRTSGPRSTTTTSSAASAVDSRCAIVTDVRPDISRSSARPMRVSSSGSTALVASSSTSRSGSASWARSSATSCRSPADKDSPR